MKIIEARTGTAFKLKKGEYLTVTDIEGEQVSDMLAYNIEDVKEVISSGRSLDYAENIYLTTGTHCVAAVLSRLSRPRWLLSIATTTASPSTSYMPTSASTTARATCNIPTSTSSSSSCGGTESQRNHAY